MVLLNIVSSHSMDEAVRITANYTGWTMSNASYLYFFKIWPLATIIWPASVYSTYCTAVQALIQIIKLSNYFQFALDFILTISFSVKLLKHASQSGCLQCLCSISHKNISLSNILILDLEVDILNISLFMSNLLLNNSFLSCSFAFYNLPSSGLSSMLDKVVSKSQDTEAQL